MTAAATIADPSIYFASAKAFAPRASGVRPLMALLRYGLFPPATSMSPQAARRPSRSDVALPRGADPDRAQRDAHLAALLHATAAGDCGAFEAFYDATFSYARTLAHRVLRGAEAEDLLADAYFECWRNAARFDAARGSAVTWLLTVVHSRALDLLRRQATHPHAEADDVAPEIADTAAVDPADALWQVQASSRLHDALAKLGANERWVLGLAYFREMSHSEIASATGMPLGSVKSLINRSQARLRAALAS
jgi:RNA polymerase sigma-70 factor (ECF subfamily)